MRSFPERYRVAVHDAELQRNLREFQRNWRASRDRTTGDIDFEGLRARLKSVKDEVIANLPEYVDRFADAARAQGATVVHAMGPDEAIRYVVQLATDSGAKTIVKSKSMVTEEIDLNEGLLEAGLKVVETDLGEWIVQLAGERPSHIVGPALHKNRRQVAELFARATGRAVDADDIGAQVAVAREALRGEFLSGDLGISGANALIIETGGIVLVTNEGNAELVTSLPRVHVVVAGIEKVLPTVDDALLQLSILAPSATGQRASTYVSFIAPPDDPEHEMHIVLVDNGRSAMRQAPEFADALRCIRCGACSSVCPPYGVVGGHVFGYIYSGAIGLVNTPFHHGLEHDAGPQGLCVSCNACQSVCPVDIPLPRQILDTRAAVVARNDLPFLQSLGLRVWSQPRLFGALARMGAIAQKPVQRGRFLAPPAPHRLTSWRQPPALARRPFRDLPFDGAPDPVPGPLGKTLDGIRVAYFVQCLTDWLYPEMGSAIVDVLRGLGATVQFPRTQHCCGLPAIDSGAVDAARGMARQTIETLERCEADFIVTGGTSCAIAVGHDYPHLFRDDLAWRERAEGIASRMMDFTTFMQSVAQLPGGALTGFGGTFTYHYFCQSYNVLGFREEPLKLLRDLCGLEHVPLPEAHVCCGFGGSVSVKYPEMCAKILDRKLENVTGTGAAVLVTDNPGCIMHLRGGLAARGEPIEVRHTAEVVAERIQALRLHSE